MVVTMRDVMQMCFIGFSIQIELSCCGWICIVICSLLGNSAFSDDEFCHPKLKNVTKNKEVSCFGSNKAKSLFSQLTCMYV